jgi:hypothetical protein
MCTGSEALRVRNRVSTFQSLCRLGSSVSVDNYVTYRPNQWPRAPVPACVAHRPVPCVTGCLTSVSLVGAAHRKETLETGPRVSRLPAVLSLLESNVKRVTTRGADDISPQRDQLLAYAALFPDRVWGSLGGSSH